MNATLKLAGNGVYGKSNSIYSPFYDPKYTFTVTVNGQLQLTQLVESLTFIPGLELIQANTDGVTAYVPRELEWMFNLTCQTWETETKLKLEHVEYDAMFIRDVNNYIAVKKDGSIKRKGAYWYPEKLKDYEGYWNKDYSEMIVPKMASHCLIRGWKPEDIVRMYTDPYDFMIREKSRGQDKHYIGDKQMTKTTRFYVSTKGEPMKKVSPPTGAIGSYKRKPGLKDSQYNKILKEIPEGTWDARIHTKNKSVHEIRETSVKSGRLVKCCNNVKDFDMTDIDYDYYVEEVKKILF